MRWNCGPTRADKREAKKRWHSWFAWLPTRVAPNDCRWMETIERRGERRLIANGDGMPERVWEWEYRPAESGAS